MAIIAALATAMSSVLAGPALAAPTASPTAAASPSQTAPAATDTSAPPTFTARPAPTATPNRSDSTTSGSATSAPSPQRTPTAQSAGCGGKLTFGVIVTCPSIVDEQENVWKITTRADSDTLLTQLTRGTGTSVQARVFDGSGEFVCHVLTDAGSCQLGAAGTYTIRVKLPYPTGTGDYTLAVESTRRPSSCDRLSRDFFSFASPGRTDTLPAGTAAHCYKFDQPVGSVLHLADPGGAGDVQGDILDGEFQPLCQVRYTTECTLGRPGPYRLFLREYYGGESTYTLKLPRISQAFGCPALPLAPFGDPGTRVGTGTVAQQDDLACHALKTTAPTTVVVRLGPDQLLPWRIVNDAGQQVCEKYSADRYCLLPAAGAYTLLVRNDSWNSITYRVAVAATSRNNGCAPATGTSWDQPALVTHQISPVQTNCQPFRAEAGERIITYTAPERYNEVAAWLVDPSGAVLCTEWSEQDGCVVPATGTYRVISYLRNWDAESTDLTYKVQVRRLSDAVGCPIVGVGAYNAPPSGALGGVRCRTLDVPTAGAHRVRAVSADNYRQWATVYDSAGVRVCTDIWCDIPAAGRYTLVLGGGAPNTVIDNDYQYAVALLPWKPSGCTPVSDTGWQDAPHRGAFDAVGQYNCLQLPSPTGARVVGLLAGDASSPEVSVLNGNGEQVCDYFSLRQYSCELTGEAPFSVVLTTDEEPIPATYALGFARVDGPPACPVLPADATGATVTTGADHFAACFTIPADQRASRESFTWTRTSGTGDARLSVLDSQGIRYCGPTGYAVERTISCTLPAGPVTVLLETDAVDATYRLTHRDASLPAG
ncbi:hypothetical protein [Micromonospora sp. WMMD812]|uniref:hypothetical protein n=1 Tax=Micromonospora sp. WMMD812 TaxID=3015152 RepID=UPI00248B9B85|nr:hypothetical protein [Micromonospora sp. WMMD812]WBB65949.1 hypothetical protein O7603_22590 [Micromonospora sp. WMMD812]